MSLKRHFYTIVLGAKKPLDKRERNAVRFNQNNQNDEKKRSAIKRRGLLWVKLRFFVRGFHTLERVPYRFLRCSGI